jgi:hypothetical protein
MFSEGYPILILPGRSCIKKTGLQHFVLLQPQFSLIGIQY